MGIFSSITSWVGSFFAPETKQITVRAGAASRLVNQSIRDVPLTEQLARVGGSKTPTQVSNYFAEADAGYMRNMVDLAYEMREKDNHLQSVLQTREAAISGLQWGLKLPEKTRKKDRKASEWLFEVLSQCPGVSDDGEKLQTFEQYLEHLAGASYLPYAVSENIFGIYKDKIVPVGFNNISARRFVFDQWQGKLHLHDFGQSYPGIPLDSFSYGKITIHQPRTNGDVPTREGLCRPLIWAALFRNWDLKDWIATGELAWKPWRIGKYQKKADRKDLSEAESGLRTLTSSGMALIPETIEFAIEWAKGSQGSGSQHQILFMTLAGEMSKAVLGQTLTTDQGSVGSLALGQVHNQVRKDLREKDARSIAATVQRDLIQPLIWMNFGTDVAVPKFRFLTEDSLDLASFSSGISQLVDKGLRVPASWVRDKIGAPDPEEEEEVMGEALPSEEEEEPPKPEPTEPPPDEEPKPENDSEESDQEAEKSRWLRDGAGRMLLTR